MPRLVRPGNSAAISERSRTPSFRASSTLHGGVDSPMCPAGMKCYPCVRKVGHLCMRCRSAARVAASNVGINSLYPNWSRRTKYKSSRRAMRCRRGRDLPSHIFSPSPTFDRSARFYETVFRRSHFEQRRQQRRARVHPDREHVAHCQRRRRSDPRQTIGNAQRPRRPGCDQQLYEYTRCGYPSVLWLWRNRGAEFITEPKDKYGETRCYIRDPDGYIIEVGQSKPAFTYG
jgi:hypothetical protein